jgi:hypothetical protein
MRLLLTVAFLGAAATAVPTPIHLTADDAREAAILEARRMSLKPELFDVSVFPEPSTYTALVSGPKASPVFKTAKYGRALSVFWIVQFDVRPDPTQVSAGSDSWFFVDAMTRRILAIAALAVESSVIYFPTGECLRRTRVRNAEMSAPTSFDEEDGVLRACRCRTVVDSNGTVHAVAATAIS